ncbi:MAG: T9SS type A sorting domain-containing protein [candidate division WOR-3 bacterium]
MKRLLLSGLILFISLASAWTPPERVDRKPDNYVTYDNDIAVDRNGTPHIVWSECKRETYYEKVMYARRDGDTWTIPVNVSRDSGDFLVVAIAIDTFGVPIVVWSKEYEARIRYSRLVGDTWSVPKLVFPIYAFTPRLVVDHHNRIHLLCESPGTSEGVIWYSYYISDADSWAEPCTVAFCPSRGLGWSNITVDRYDRLHAVWMDYQTYGLGYSYKDSSGWSEPMRLPDPSGSHQSCDPAVACDLLGRPHVVWEERSGGYWIYYSMFDGDSWSTPFLLYEEGGGRPQIVCDRYNRLHVVWACDYGLRHKIKADTGWIGPIVVTERSGLLALTAGTEALHLATRLSGFCLYYLSHNLSEGVEENGLLNNIENSPRLMVPGMTKNGLEVGYIISKETEVLLEVFDVQGRCVWQRRVGKQKSGWYKLRVPAPCAGLYFVRLIAGPVILTRRCVKVK